VSSVSYVPCWNGKRKPSCSSVYGLLVKQHLSFFPQEKDMVP